MLNYCVICSVSGPISWSTLEGRNSACTGITLNNLYTSDFYCRTFTQAVADDAMDKIFLYNELWPISSFVVLTYSVLCIRLLYSSMNSPESSKPVGLVTLLCILGSYK